MGKSGTHASLTEAVKPQRVANLLGDTRILRSPVESLLDAHEMLLEGLPGGRLSYLVDNLVVLRQTGSLEDALGMSLRTIRRHKDAPRKPLSPKQSGRVWTFA